MSEPRAYVCRNPACALGTPGAPGRFTGGIGPVQATALSGDPEAPSGEGVCPNCGRPGEPEDGDG